MTIVQIISVLASLLICSLASVSSANDRHITALVPEDWPPQYQLDKKGNPSGFAIDVMDAIAAQGQFKVVYKTFPNFPSAVDALVAGEGDLIPNSGILPDRLDDFVFTSPVETFFVRVFVRANDTRIKGYPDLSGKTVAVVENNVGLFMLQGRRDISLRIENSLQSALFSLISGNADALLYPSSVALAIARNAGIDERISAVGEPVKEVLRGIRLPIANQALRDELEPLVQEFVKTDAYIKIYQKWYGKPPPLISGRELWMIFAAAMLSLSAVFLFWRHQSLRALNVTLNAENRAKNIALIESERLLEMTGQTAALGGWELDVKSGKLHWTNQVFEIHNLPHGDKPQDLDNALTFYPECDRARVREHLKLAAERGIPYDIETKFVSASGQKKWVRSICKPEMVEGTVVKLIGTFQDVTDKKNSEIALIESIQRAENLVEQKEVLIQEVHHRVKNNIQVILSMLSLQKRAAYSAHEEQALNESSRRVRVMGKLYEHLYQSEDVSEIDAQKYFSDVLNDSMGASSDLAEIKSSLECDPIRLDIKTATALAQIISELVSNCIKHAFPDGCGSIEVSFRKSSEGVISLIVKDDGIGLPKGFEEAKLKSMGIKLVNALVSQLGADKIITSQNGTTVQVSFKEVG